MNIMQELENAMKVKHRITEWGSPEHREATFPQPGEAVVAIGQSDPVGLASPVGAIGFEIMASVQQSLAIGPIRMTLVCMVNNDTERVELIEGMAVRFDEAEGNAQEKLYFEDGTYVYMMDVLSVRLDGHSQNPVPDADRDWVAGL